MEYLDKGEVYICEKTIIVYNEDVMRMYRYIEDRRRILKVKEYSPKEAIYRFYEKVIYDIKKGDRE